MAGKPAPDWYPDPENPAILRWWDGARWSGETRAAGQPGTAFPSPGPGMAGGAFGDAGSGADGSERTGMQASWREPALESWAEVYRAAAPVTGTDSFPVRRWVLGGAAAMIIAGVAVWFLVGALDSGGGHPAAPRPPAAFRGGVVTDRAAGISFTIPGGAGWVRMARPGDGFTVMLRRPAPGARPGQGREWAVAAAEPLPAVIAYHGTADLRADGVRAAGAIARRYVPGYHGRLRAVVRRVAGSAAGQLAYVVTFRIGNPGGRGGGNAGQSAALVIVSRGRGKRPGLLFVTVPATMSTRLIGQITQTARPAA